MSHQKPRTTCPVCTRNVVERKGGGPIAHYPPADRLDLANPQHGGRLCPGSYREAQAFVVVADLQESA